MLHPQSIKYLKKGRVYEKNDRYHKALCNYNKALTLTPNSTIILNDLGVVYKKMEKYNCSMEMYERALSLCPNDETTLVNLGVLYSNLGDFQMAKKYYQKVKKFNPNHHSLSSHFGTLLVAKGTISRQSGIAHLRRASTLEPSNVNTHLNLIYSLSKKGDLLSAMRACESAIDQCENHPRLICWLSRHHQDCGRNKEGIKYLNLAKNILHHDYCLDNTLLNCKKTDKNKNQNNNDNNNDNNNNVNNDNNDYNNNSDNNNDNNNSDMEKENDPNPDGEIVNEIPLSTILTNNSSKKILSLDIVIDMVKTLIQLKQKKELKYWGKILSSYKNCGRTNITYIANLLVKCSLNQEAIEWWRKSIILGVSGNSGINNLAVLLLKTNQVEESIETAKIATSIQPGNAVTWYNLGCAYKAKSQIEKAKEHFLKSLECHPSYTNSMYQIAMCSTEKSERLKWLKKAIKINPKNNKFHLKLALLLFQLEKYSCSKKQFKYLSKSSQDKKILKICQEYLLRIQKTKNLKQKKQKESQKIFNKIKKKKTKKCHLKKNLKRKFSFRKKRLQKQN
ncbi:lipopolysaccharide assembly protein b [Anaeramoeba flamelloides]|uniref:Lipopolysaccharide assembly protein b n=1 Tax=Anaeramoeba flamelloides TaxID=1746091 RepID=A0AAV7YZW0_9EUKA|nr:lipopolysaccharide assembly protein b [Anaeramoeba flamelloides]